MMPENLTLERAALRAEWQQKTIKDDPIFGTVMTNPNLCAECCGGRYRSWRFSG